MSAVSEIVERDEAGNVTSTYIAFEKGRIDVTVRTFRFYTSPLALNLLPVYRYNSQGSMSEYFVNSSTSVQDIRKTMGSNSSKFFYLLVTRIV
jgi:hypothetical protein